MEKISHFRLYKRHRATLYRQIQKNTDYERPAWNNITALAMKTGIPERIVRSIIRSDRRSRHPKTEYKNGIIYLK